MSKTIVFNSRLESFLKKHKVKTAFVKNVRTQWGFNRRDPISNKIKSINEDVYSPISGAFTWSITPERHEFWSKLNKLYNK